MARRRQQDEETLARRFVFGVAEQFLRVRAHREHAAGGIEADEFIASDIDRAAKFFRAHRLSASVRFQRAGMLKMLELARAPQRKQRRLGAAPLDLAGLGVRHRDVAVGTDDRQVFAA